MRYSAMIGALVSAAAVALGAAMPPLAASNGLGPALAPTLRQKRGKGENNRRGKGERARPKKRRNMLLVSKRVRRKHRRRAA